MNQWMDKEDVVCVCVYIYNGILLNHKREWNFTICDSVDRPGEYYV